MKLTDTLTTAEWIALQLGGTWFIIGLTSIIRPFRLLPVNAVTRAG